MIRRLFPLAVLLLSASVATADNAPAILSLSPSSTVVGTGSFTLTVNGVNFVSASQVRVDGAGRTTTFVNGGQLTATIQSGDVISVRTLQITVANPGGLTPSTIVSGSGPQTVVVIGANFTPTSTVQINGTPRS